jgi:hypothetical protein
VLTVWRDKSRKPFIVNERIKKLYDQTHNRYANIVPNVITEIEEVNTDKPVVEISETDRVIEMPPVIYLMSSNKIASTNIQ